MRVHVQAYIFIRIKCIIFPQISASSVFQIEEFICIQNLPCERQVKNFFSGVWYHYNYNANVHLNSFPQPPI